MTTVTPLEIRRCPETAELQLTWSDDRVDRLPYSTLRSNCRCASCRNGGPRRDDSQVGIDNAVLFGGYALRLFFDDGHNTGLYPFDYLRTLALTVLSN